MKNFLLFVISFYSVQSIYAQSGEPDSSFGTNGIVLNDSMQLFSMAVQEDGKIVAAGISNNDLALARYNRDGSPDNTFAVNGLQITSVISAFPVEVSRPVSVAIQQDGKIVIVGNARVNGADLTLVIARYKTDGSPDSSLSGDGQRIYDAEPAFFGYANSVAVQSDNKIVVAGYAYNGTSQDFTLARFDADGSPDNTFNGSGKQATGFGPNDDYAYGVAIQPDGKIVAAGSTWGAKQNFALARYNTDGSPDETFGNNGKQITDFGPGTAGYSVAIQRDGKIIVAGQVFNESFDFACARYNTDGSLDNTFNGNGKQSTSFGSGTVARANSVAVQGNQKIILAGDLQSPDAPADFALVRYNDDGTPDDDFSGDGKKVTELGPDGGIYIFDIAVGDNKLYAAGITRTPNGSGPLAGAILRYSLDDKNKAPDVAITDPYDNTNFTGPALVPLTAEANDADGSITKVEFYNGTALLRTEYLFPYSWNWKDVAPGNYTITAKAYDNSGNTATSLPVVIMVLPNKPPAVHFTGPVDQQVFSGPSTIALETDATDTDGNIVKVELYDGEKLLRTEYFQPYTWNWENVPLGNHIVTAKAYDNNGGSATSPPVHITVAANQPPVLSIIQPFNNQVISGPVDIILQAAASDPDGNIAKVDFYAGESVLRTEYFFPYSWKWKNVVPGHYIIVAKATDNLGKQASSEEIAITVTSPEKTVANRPAAGDELKKNVWPAIKIVPDPATDVINVYAAAIKKDPLLTVSVISASGTVMQTKYSLLSKESIQLDVSSLVSGVYHVRITTAGTVLYSRFVKL